MSTLAPEFGRQLVSLLRDYLRQQADIRSLSSILTHAETSEAVPYGWLEALKLLRETPEYIQIAAEHEAAFLAVEERADQLEIEQLLATMPATRYPN
jgi:hypothetical protein